MITPKALCASLALAGAFSCFAATAGDGVVARVADTVITQQEFEAAMSQAARSKFYHFKAPEGELAALQREVIRNMTDAVLLQKEAKRRKLTADDAAIKKTLDGYDERYRASDEWKANRARLLPQLKAKLEEDSVREKLSAQVRRVAEPSEKEVAQYWETHKDKFTSPEQLRLSVILLKVDPSSPPAKWEGAKAEGAAIVKRLKAGADFAQLAQMHSNDPSAERGGDLGYVHKGMLADAAQAAVDGLKPGEVSQEAVVVLEGVAVFKLHERIAAQLNPLEKVKQRARDLLVRDREDAAWQAFLAKLRRETPVQLDETRMLPLASVRPSSTP